MLARLGPLLDKGLASGIYHVLHVSLLLAVPLLAAWCWRLSRRYQVLAHLSTRDPLTGLLNGSYFEAERWPALLRGTAPLALLFLDLDHLKQNNARFGHSGGDRYIAAAADVLRRACRRGLDEIFRLYTAGDEFAVTLQGRDACHASTVADSLLERLRQAKISVSIGVAWTTDARHEVRAALRKRAEAAMHQAKAEGKGRVVVMAVRAEEQGAHAAANVPEPIHTAPQPPCRILPTVTRGQVKGLLDNLLHELRPLLPGHRFELDIPDDLPCLAVDEDHFVLIMTGLLLDAVRASLSVRLVARCAPAEGQIPNPTPDAAQAIVIRCETKPSAVNLTHFLAFICDNATTRAGGRWTLDDQGVRTAWPAVQSSPQ